MTLRRLRNYSSTCSSHKRSSRQSCILIVALICISFNVVVADDTGAAPSVPPIFAPVVVPETLMPVPNPTDIPSLSPSRQPTLAPTLPPTPEPTKPPTLDPTEMPTGFPTLSPSKAPSPSPSITASVAPSIKTSGTPTMDPTPVPTSLPSPSPTLYPSQAPSLTPSLLPTLTLSVLPSHNPTSALSAIPTISPSLRPSLVPSTTGSAVPSLRPSRTPSFAPTISEVPSQLPTFSPSAFPSPPPSQAPSLSTQQYLVQVVMFFDDAQVLVGSSEIMFQRITADHIFDELINLEGLEYPLMGLTVGTNIKDQQVQLVERRRRLQSSPLKLVFDTAVTFQSISPDLDVASMVGGAFNTDEDRAKYLNLLQSSGDRSFSSINIVRVEINGIPQVVEPVNANDDTGGGINLFVWIGAAAGGAAILILVGLYFLRSDKPQKLVTVVAASTNVREERLNTDILMMEAQDDISTLGDPMYGPGGMIIPGLEKDDTVAASIVSGDYDYSRKYGGVDASPRTRADTLQSSVDGSQHNSSNTDLSCFGGLGKMDNSIFSDDSSFEQQFANMEERFEVDAPSGKLGMVIDTPSGGVPVVHAIKETSVLADRVDVGDRLMSVDDEDTTGLTAMQVSKLISHKAENPSRILVFGRTRARTESGDLPQ